MRNLVLAIVVIIFCSAQFATGAEPARLPRSAPESQGVSSAALLDFVESADRDMAHLHSFMLVRHGHVIAEGWWKPYDAGTRHELYSLSKSFTSTAVGLAIGEGRFSLDDQVEKFFPDDLPAEPGNQLKGMRVRDLLCMSTGHESEPKLSASEAPWTKTFLAHPVPFKPGAHFMYNTPATYMLSAIVQRQTGMTVLDYLRPRLFEPLGIEDPTWGTSPQGVSLGGYGLSIRTEDIACFGQLFLQQGQWRGRQLIFPSWIAAATGRQTSNGSNPQSDWDQGYGYQFWRCRHGGYRGDGAFGQFCIVLPEQDAVVAITSGVKDMQAVLNLVWDKLLPAMRPEAIAANHAENEKLRNRLAGLVLPTQTGDSSAAIAAKITGARYAFPANDQKVEMLGLDFAEKTGAVKLFSRINGVDRQNACGFGEWLSGGRLAYDKYVDQPVAACGAWTAADIYTARICFCETPFTLTVNFKFTDSQVSVDCESNMGFGTTKRLPLIGTAAAK